MLAVNSISSVNCTKKQSFGAMLPIKPEVQEYLLKDVFKNDQDVMDKFILETKNAEIEQRTNPLFDIEMIKVNLTNSFPGARLLVKDKGEIAHLDTHQPKYNGLDEKTATFKVLEDANELATTFLQRMI